MNGGININYNYNNWITLSEQYLMTSKLIMEQIKTHQNKWFMIDDKPIEWTRYIESTKWSDFNTFVPSLFLLQHGFELLLKGLMIMLGKPIELKHDVDTILDILSKEAHIDNEIIERITYYVGKNPKNHSIKEFHKLNKHLNTLNNHVNLRYPEMKGNDIDFSSFRYKEHKLLSELDEIIGDIDKIFNKSIEVIRAYERKKNQ